MTKFRTNRAELTYNNRIIVGIGYCDIQNIERFLRPNAYTCGVYGWNSDIYEFESFAISTGYRPIRYVYSKDKKLQAESDLLYKYLRDLDSRIEQKKIKLPTDWSKASRKVYKLINDAQDRICRKVNKGE